MGGMMNGLDSGRYPFFSFSGFQQHQSNPLSIPPFLPDASLSPLYMTLSALALSLSACSPHSAEAISLSSITLRSSSGFSLTAMVESSQLRPITASGSAADVDPAFPATDFPGTKNSPTLTRATSPLISSDTRRSSMNPISRTSTPSACAPLKKVTGLKMWSKGQKKGGFRSELAIAQLGRIGVQCVGAIVVIESKLKLKLKLQLKLKLKVKVKVKVKLPTLKLEPVHHIIVSSNTQSSRGRAATPHQWRSQKHMSRGRTRMRPSRLASSSPLRTAVRWCCTTRRWKSTSPPTGESAPRNHVGSSSDHVRNFPLV
mmetsp:Transcript_30801/g.76623  ORF Transcript_30801/g.76623 Transcript_30801/m.76623 type:complete len:315 (+) Transcript_30801:162-1106(+)